MGILCAGNVVGRRKEGTPWAPFSINGFGPQEGGDLIGVAHPRTVIQLFLFHIGNGKIPFPSAPVGGPCIQSSGATLVLS